VQKKESTPLRTSTHNIVIPLSFPKKPLYILANPLYGAASLIDEKEYKALREVPLNSTLVSQFKEAGYITTLTEAEEQKLMEKRYNAQKKVNDPRAAIVLTYQCNLRCTYCWTDHLFGQNAQRVSTVIDEKTVDAAFNCIPKIPALDSVKVMSLYGGEPFLPSTFSVTEYILKKGSERDYTFHANTNGYYLTTFVPLLAQYSVSGLGVTLDGPPSVHDKRRIRADGKGTFHQIAEGIDTALDSDISIGVRINVDGENFSYLPAFRDWIREHGWANRKGLSFAIALIRPGKDNSPPKVFTYAEMGRKILEMMKESPSIFRFMHYLWEYTEEGYLTRLIRDGSELKPRPFYCSAHYQGFAFDPFGDIYSCPRAVGDRTFSIGRFIPELQFNENYDTWVNRDVLSIPKCQECDLALLCGGGCAYEAFLDHGTICEGYCDRYKAFVEYGLPHFVGMRMRMKK